MATAADVPNRYDVVINGVGFMFLETEQKQATFGFSPTFLERTNISQAYGDEDQDFWLTMSQKDWSLGEGQRSFDVANEDSVRRYWYSEGCRVDVPGRISLLKTRTSFTANGAPDTNLAWGPLDTIIWADGTNLYQVDSAGSDSTVSAHGATSPTACIFDGENVYVSGSTGNLRKYDGAWATFSGTASPVLAFLNNTLYGAEGAELRRYSTGGTATTIFTFQSGDGTATGNITHLTPFGGDLLIGFKRAGVGREVWIYDGVAPAKILEMPRGVDSIFDIVVVGGVVFLPCVEATPYGDVSSVYYFSGGTLGNLWRSQSTGATVTRACEYAGTLVFTDGADSTVKQYNPETGAIVTLFDNPVAFSSSLGGLIGANDFLVTLPDSTTGRVYPASSAETSGAITLSLFDGATTRDKRFKSVIVEYDEGSDGDGGSVDVSYRLNDVDSTFTSIQTGLTSGTEYAIGQVGRSISIRLTLNKGTSTNGPVVKRVYVRAAPTLDSFRRNQYVLNLTGRDGRTPLALRDGTFEPADGLSLAQSLTTAIQSTTAISITDEFGTYTAILEPDKCEIVRVRQQEYVAIVQARQV